MVRYLYLKRSVIKPKALKILLKYAFPCIVFWRRERNIDEKTILQIYKIATGEEEPTPEISQALEKLIPVAIRELESMSSGVITEDIVREYFLKRHPKVIGEDKPEWIRDLCLVKTGVINKIRGCYGEVVFEDGKRRLVRLDFIKKPKVGDKVTVHYTFACEKIE